MKIKTSTRHCVHVRGPVFALLATACLSASLSAHAGDSSSFGLDPIKKIVTYGDLNLATPQGVQELYRRIYAASQQVCQVMDGGALEQKARLSLCTTQSIAHAVAAVDEPALTALQAAKTGQHDWTVRVAKR
jgi:UrcA family protein